VVEGSYMYFVIIRLNQECSTLYGVSSRNCNVEFRILGSKDVPRHDVVIQWTLSFSPGIGRKIVESFR